MSHIDTLLDQIETSADAEFPIFYDILSWTDAGLAKTFRINYFKLVELLKSMGFYRIDFHDKSFIVRIINNVAEEVDQKVVIDAFVAWLDQFEEEMPGGLSKERLINKIYGGLGTFFSDHILNRLVNGRKWEFCADTLHHAYFYYENGFVKVSAQEISFHPYERLNTIIWKNQILARKFKLLPEAQYRDFCWSRFVSNIADNIADKEGEGRDPLRFESLKTIIGYNLHKYYEGKLRATVFTDSRISDEPEGRSGKTLLGKGIGMMLNVAQGATTYVEVNGKNFDFKDKFRYTECKIDTKCVHINDAQAYFDFTLLYNDITEGIKVRHLHQEPFLILSKIIISTNRTIRMPGGSSRDRAIEFEMADYYSAEYSPETEFGHWFFRDWSPEQWNQFDNFMIHCVQTYLRKGLIRPGYINLLDRKLNEETCIDFVNFMQDKLIQHGEKYNKSEFHSDFLKRYPDWQLKKLTQHRFTKWLKLYATYTRHIDRFEESRGHGVDFFQYFFKQEHIDKESTAPAALPPEQKEIPF